MGRVSKHILSPVVVLADVRGALAQAKHVACRHFKPGGLPRKW